MRPHLPQLGYRNLTEGDSCSTGRSTKYIEGERAGLREHAKTGRPRMRRQESTEGLPRDRLKEKHLVQSEHCEGAEGAEGFGGGMRNVIM